MIPSTQDIIKAAADYYDVTTDDILSPSRASRVSEARGVACYLMQLIRHMTSVEAGAAVNRSHSTVLHHTHNIVIALIRGDRRVTQAVRHLKEQLGHG